MIDLKHRIPMIGLMLCLTIACDRKEEQDYSDEIGQTIKVANALPTSRSELDYDFSNDAVNGESCACSVDGCSEPSHRTFYEKDNVSCEIVDADQKIAQCSFRERTVGSDDSIEETFGPWEKRIILAKNYNGKLWCTVKHLENLN
ncbi:hypothetical protein [Sphingopyxis sp. BSNA05]|uniref:hypothetical protein n=1 Tax=Sphingopyxis sp. BSNA05 TaxID=1236614 RepID=UPI0015633EB9|nr:hypothetical protein [Sphingopyxis sp. BSNA05]